MASLKDWENNSAIKTFREYLRIPSVQPDINYDECITFLKKQADSLGLSYQIYVPVPKKPILVMTWVGTNPNLPAILLNSHMDVVTVYPESWTYPPFSAHLTKDGYIYGRGAQDMKCVGIQYLEAIRNLKENNIKLLRTVHISFVPDEETGGILGMYKFVTTEGYKGLNVGFSLDEGMANLSNEFPVYYAERTIWYFRIKCPGTTGHGSLLLPGTAGEKVRYILNKFLDYRENERKKLESDASLTDGDVTSINLMDMYGGVQVNVLPEMLTMLFDVRVAVDVDHEAFEKEILDWCTEAGGAILEFEQKDVKNAVTKLDESNPFWVAFKQATDQMNMKLKPSVFPGGSDSRFIRLTGVPALGFSPMNNTPKTMHQHDEFLHADVFLKGIEIYEKIIFNISNVP